MARRTPKSLTFSGRVFCDKTCFTMLLPTPQRLQAGDLIIWSWSGDSKEPRSKRDKGLFRVSVFDGKDRRMFVVKNTRVHGVLKFDSDRARGELLRQLIAELRLLRKEDVFVPEKGVGYYATLVEPTPEPEPQKPATTPPTATKADDPPAQEPARVYPRQGKQLLLFEP